MIARVLFHAWLLLAAMVAAVGAEETPPPPWPPQDAIHTWRVGSGLPHQRVQAVCQTDDGFLWVGTAQGLVRFDGLKFDSAPLPGNPSVVRLAAGRGNRLWVATADRTLWAGDGMRFEKVFTAGFPGGFEILSEDRDGRLWISSSIHYRVYLWEKGILRDMTAHWDHHDKPGHVSQIRLDENGRPIANGQLIWRIEGETPVPIPAYRQGMIYHAPGREDSYWVSEGGSVYLLSGGKLSAAVGPADWEGRVLTFGIEDREGNLWVASDGAGILCFQRSGGRRRLDTRDGLCGDFASCLYVDRQGNLWVGSDGGGLSRVTPAFCGVAGRTRGLSSDRVTAIAQGRDHTLWIGTHADGLNRYDGTSFSKVAGFPEKAGVRALAVSGESVWIGKGDGLAVVRDGSVEMVRGWTNAGRAVEALHMDRAGRLWIGQRTKGIVGCLRDGQMLEIRLREGSPTEFDVRAFAEDPEGRMWIATDGAGLFHYSDGKAGPVGAFRQVTALECGDAGTMWVAADGDLARIHRDAEQWTIETGWHTGVLHTLRGDGRGGLWATDDRGICRLDTTSRPARLARFGQADGLPGLQGAGGGDPQSVCDASGRMWFATTAGVVVVETDRFPAEAPVPAVRLEGLRVNGSLRWESGQTGMPEFQSSDRAFDFRFTAMDLRHPEMLEFATFLEGVDERWTEIGNAHSVFHATLPPGTHRFHVKVRDRNGHWSTVESIDVRILPPLWQRGWFIVLAAFSATGLAAFAAWLVGRWRLQRQLAALTLQHALESERARIARDLHDQLGSGLTQIAFLGDSLRMDADPSGDAAEVSSRARELTRTMDETVWALDPAKDTIQGLVSYLGHAMPLWLKGTGIRFRLDLPDESVRFGLDTRVRRELYLACKEAVHNVVKHSGAATVTLSIGKVGRSLVINLSDHGKGFDPAAGSSGNGLANMRRRLQEIGGSAEIESSPGEGTTVRFTLPLPQAI